ncbi:MAG: hypothetical protein H0W58_16980 [Acidobacteria bacterium]|nr:hypothetical protein [Acidobacteriota bacterium]
MPTQKEKSKLNWSAGILPAHLPRQMKCFSCGREGGQGCPRSNASVS